MKIAIASGKGGTGKTTVAVNLAMSIDRPVQILDCDVEEPNCHIFLKPEFDYKEEVHVLTPRVDTELCSHCGQCGDICQFSAIVSLKTSPLVFPEMCHGCGGCFMVCPENAISETHRTAGVIEGGHIRGLMFAQGKTRIGEAMSPPVIRAVKKKANSTGITIIDAPPGTSCPTIAAVKETDFIVLVTEPTPFGLHDLALAVDMVRVLCIPFGVVINRSGIGDNRVLAYCEQQGIPVLKEIPNERKIAEIYSRGEIIVDVLPKYKKIYRDLMQNIERRLNTK